MAANTEAERKELVRIWKAQEKELADMDNLHGPGPGRYLANDVLEIKREQYLNDGKWDTSKYILVTAIGGPHVEFNTNHLIAVYWAGGIVEYMTDDKKAKATIDNIAAYLDELYR